MKKSTNELQAELDAVITWLASDEADIDQAEAKYKQGLEIARELKKRLEQTENSIKKLKVSFDENSS